MQAVVNKKLAFKHVKNAERNTFNPCIVFRYFKWTYCDGQVISCNKLNILQKTLDKNDD